MNRFYKIFIFLTLFIGSSLVANAQDLSFKVGLSGTVTELDATGEELTGLDPQERNNYINMRTTLSGTTQMEFSTVTVDESIDSMNRNK